ncbi:MAG: ABC transporter permease [Tyzzerella sp.]|nr:ABC transporter permease [Tyzzerella sp.]
MTLLNRLTLKNLKLNKKRTIVTVIGIILSVALLTAVASMFFSARESLIQFQKQEQGNYHYSFTSVLQEGVQELKQNRKIESLYVTKTLGYAKLDGVENEYKPYAYVKEFDQEALENMSITLTEGRLPENANEILIPTHLKSNGGLALKVGETITLEVGTRVSEGGVLNQFNPFNTEVPEEIVDTQTKTYKIVGIMERFAYRIENYEAPGYTFVSYLEDSDSVKEADVYVRYTKEGLKDYLRTTAQILEVDEEAYVALNGPGAAFTEEEHAEFQEKVGEPKYDAVANDYLITLESGVFGDSTLNALASAVVIVVIIIIVTSVFCIKNSFDISITEKIRQYGMLASIGATKKQIKKNVYYEAMILGALGIPLGILSGVFAAFVLIQISNLFIGDMLDFDLVFSFSWLAILFAVVLGIVTLLLSARKSANRASKIAPIQAIRNSGEIKIRAKKIKSPKWVKKVFGIGGEISYKNLQRSKKKYRTTVVSIVVCVSVFIALSSFVNLAFDTIRAEFQGTDYNLQLVYQNNEEIEEKKEEIRNLEGVKRFIDTAFTSVEFEADEEQFTDEYLKVYPKAGKDYKDENGEMQKYYESLDVRVINEEAFQEYVESLHLKYEEVKEKGILLNTVWVSQYDEEGKYSQIEMEQYSMKAGDRIKGQVTLDYDEDAQNATADLDIEIAKVTDEVPMGMEEYRASASLVVGGSYYGKILNSHHHAYIYIDSEDAGKTQEEIEEIFDNMSSYDGYYHLNNLEENARMMQSFYTLISIFLYGFITVIALIGVTNIFNTITTNMNLRRREFATLKSVGMTKKEFNRMIQLESFFYGMKSLVIGIPIGCVLSYLIYHVLAGGEIVIAYSLPIAAILISIIAVFLLITVIMKYSIGKINKQNVIETIRNENI